MTLEQALETMCLDVSDLCLHSVKQQYYRLARKVHLDLTERSLQSVGLLQAV